MSLITNETLQAINAELEQKNRILLEFAQKYVTTDWGKMLLNVRAGKASEHYSIGDEFPCKYTNNGTDYNFPWIVVDIDREVEWEDGTKHPGLVLQAKYGTVEKIQFDKQEDTTVDLNEETTALEGWYYWGKTGNTYTELSLSVGDTIPTTYDSIHKCGINNKAVMQNGYGRWSHSAYRQWLNSAELAGEWWEPQHLGDIAPNQLQTVNGFMSTLENDFVDILTPIKIKTLCNTVTDSGVIDTTLDTFFLPSIEELYGVKKGTGEGPYFTYWKNATGLNAPSNDNNTARISKIINAQSGNAEIMRLRSIDPIAVYKGFCIGTNGQLYLPSGDGSVAALYSCRPVCVIS